MLVKGASSTVRCGYLNTLTQNIPTSLNRKERSFITGAKFIIKFRNWVKLRLIKRGVQQSLGVLLYRYSAGCRSTHQSDLGKMHCILHQK